MNNECPKKVVGARIAVCVEGWEAEVQYINNGDLHMETFPLRVSETLAREDVKRVAPEFTDKIVITTFKVEPK